MRTTSSMSLRAMPTRWSQKVPAGVVTCRQTSSSSKSGWCRQTRSRRASIRSSTPGANAPGFFVKRRIQFALLSLSLSGSLSLSKKLSQSEAQYRFR